MDVKLSMLSSGFIKTLLNVTEELFPNKVKLFPSAGLVATIETPADKLFEIINVPKTKAELISIDSTITWLDETTELTSKSVVNKFPTTLRDAKPIVSPTLIVERANEPPSDEKWAVSISYS